MAITYTGLTCNNCHRTFTFAETNKTAGWGKDYCSLKCYQTPKFSFREALDRASKIVDNWPQWKKDVLERINTRYRIKEDE